MQKRPVTIALAIAGIIAGTHAGIAAISTESSERSVSPAPMQTETQAAAETPAPAAVEVQAVAEAPAAAPATTAAVTAPAAPSTQSAEHHVRIPFTNYRVKVTNPTFPSAAVDTPDPSPSVIAYFDRRNANTTLAGASGPVFPGAAIEGIELSPAALAHFDRMEARRVAAVQPAAPVASTPAVEATPTAAMDLPPGNLASGLREPATVRPGT